MPDRRLLGVVFCDRAGVPRHPVARGRAGSGASALAAGFGRALSRSRHNVAAGHGFSADPAPPYRPDLRRTPGYPSLLAGAFLMPNGGLRLASLSASSPARASVAATCWTAARLFGRSAALVGGLLLAVDLTGISYSVVITDRGAVHAVARRAASSSLMKRPSGSAVGIRGGVLLGCATLCRPAGILLAPVSLPVCAWQQTGARRIARDYLRVNAAFLLVLLIWIGRNVIVAGTPTLSSIWSVNL